MSKLPKTRVDQLLVTRGLAESRARAQALILAGLVFSGEVKIAKSGQALASIRNSPGSERCTPSDQRCEYGCRMLGSV